MLTTPIPVHKTAWLLLFSLTACYLALAPGTTRDRGYLDDDMKAGMSLLSIFNAWVKGHPVPPIFWTRHGPVPLHVALRRFSRPPERRSRRNQMRLFFLKND